MVRHALVDSIAGALRRNYVWADTAARMADRLTRQIRDGAYDAISDPQTLATALTQDLRAVYRDVHLSISYDPGSARDERRVDSRAGRSAAQGDAADARRQNFGFRKVDILPGNIGYVAIDWLFDVNRESLSTLTAVFSVLRNSSALIIDLRADRGGSPEMVRQICNYLFAARTHINDLVERRSGTTTAYWTEPDRHVRTLFAVPVFVLVSRQTFSAAEELAYDLQSQRRAVIIGEITGGGAHAVRGIAVGYGFSANIPYARAINPVTGTNWEAVGVQPDIRIVADRALDAAVLQYDELALRQSTDSGERHSLEWSRDMVQARLHPIALDTLRMRDVVGVYDGRRIALDDGSLYFTDDTGETSRLIALSPSVFRPESSDEVKLEFRRDASGKVSAMVVIHPDGSTSTSARKR